MQMFTANSLGRVELAKRLFNSTRPKLLAVVRSEVPEEADAWTKAKLIDYILLRCHQVERTELRNKLVYHRFAEAEWFVDAPDTESPEERA